MNGVCFLHIGTHKTGTSSLQTLLQSNDQCLEGNGIFVPKSGRALPHSGHHNLAWELMGDSRFDSAFGSWRNFLDEVRSRNPPAICISSEEFEYLYRNPQALRRIRQDLNSIGYQVSIIVYLRPQADYIESLYVELLKNGVYLPFREYLDKLLEAGMSAPNELWMFSFDYNKLLDSFAEVFGTDRMLVRPYNANRRAKYLLKDFTSLISPGRAIRGLDFSACRRRLNASLNFGQVMELALGNRRKHGEEDLEGNIPRGLFMRGRFDALDLRDLTTIDGRFCQANQILHEKYRVKIATMTFKRLLQELICSAGLNRGSIRRKNLVRRLATMP